MNRLILMCFRIPHREKCENKHTGTHSTTRVPASFLPTFNQEHTVTLAMKRRSEGTREQEQAMQLRAMANQVIRLKQNTRLNTEQRMQLLKFLATR